MNRDSIPTTSGIYKITCLMNKKIYIGSTINLQRRRNRHFSHLRQNKHSNLHLQNAWNKYGEQAFIFEILELVLPMSLTAREQYWFGRLKPFAPNGFNIALDACLPMLGKKVSAETIERMRQAALGKELSSEQIEKIRQSNLGKKNTPEAIEKTRQAHLGRRNSPETIERMRQAALARKSRPPASEETRRKLSEARKGHVVSEETRRKISEAHKTSPRAIEAQRRVHEMNSGHPSWSKGKKFTLEHRRKISEAAKRREARKRSQIAIEGR